KFDPDSAQAAVQAMFELDLLDDERFARHREKYLISQKKSLLQVRQKLSALGISREIIYTIIEELQEQEHSEQDTLVQLIEKSYARKLEKGETEKVVGALMRRGFSYRDIKAALEEFDFEDEEQDW
ncbi:MAG: RecX family transcriptional regulator, partial [Oscillospiraceae bacterium]|nr:RecX family transcriptional regulator [Oscillospiraceae bacterium]